MRFEGRVALVTGAGAGIGRATAERLASEGACLAVVDRDRDAAEAAAAAIEESGGRALGLAADVRGAAEVAAVVERTVEAFGGLDLLANVAGVVRYGRVDDGPEEDWDLVVDTNLKGPYLGCRFAIPHMRRRGGGAIVNTASVQAFASQETVAAYSASKGGVVAMTRTLALDHASDNIRVNAIAPGSVRTPMLRASAETLVPDDPLGAMEQWGRQHPVGRLIEPAEVAALVAFLLSDEAAAMTGGTHLVDGGLLARLGV